MEHALIFYQIFSTNSLRKCMEITHEKLGADTEASRPI